jgi:hypothetical protein
MLDGRPQKLNAKPLLPPVFANEQARHRPNGLVIDRL